MSKLRECYGDQEQFWRMAIETWQSSELSVRQFCNDEGLSKSSFYTWRKKLTSSDQGWEHQDRPEPAAFVEVAIPQSNSVVVEIVLTSGTTLRIHPGTDSTTLGTVLWALRQVKLC